MRQLGIDLALLQLAGRFDLNAPNRAGRKASANWLTALFSSLLTKVRPEIFFEVGAFSAEFSRTMAPKLPDCRFLAFEANPYNFEEFREDALEAGIDYRHMAVGDHVGDTILRVPRNVGTKELPSITGRSSVLGKPGVINEEIAVQMTTIDAIAAADGLTGRRNALWIDVEGFAEAVLDGASQTLTEADFVFIEVEDRPFWEGQKTAPYIKSMLADHGLFPIARDFEYPNQYNILLTRYSIFSRADVQQTLIESIARS